MQRNIHFFNQIPWKSIQISPPSFLIAIKNVQETVPDNELLHFLSPYPLFLEQLNLENSPFMLKCWRFPQLKVKSLGRVRLFATLWTVARQALLSMGFSRQEYWSGFPFPSPADLPNPGIEPRSSALQADPLPSEPPGKQTFPQLGGFILLLLFSEFWWLYLFRKVIHYMQCGILAYILE